jgi:hypothetical protein
VAHVRSLAEAELHIDSLTVRVGELERIVSDHAQRWDTLQTPLWKRAWFRLNGWPGIRDLNAPAPRPRLWHRWLRP